MVLGRCAAAIALLLCLGCAARGPSATLTILHINDFHGELEPTRAGAGKDEEGGAARLAALVAEQRTPTTLFVAAGDLMQGARISNLNAGRPVIEAFNLMGLDASAVGNHEFDNGLATLRERAAEARFPFLAANIAGDGPWKSHEVRQVGTLRVGLFGLATEETPLTTRRSNVEGLAFLDAVDAARRVVADLRPRSDLVVALTHLGIGEDERLAAAVPGIDVIVGGHTHTKAVQPALVGRTLVLQAFERGVYLGRLDLEVAGGNIVSHRYRLIPVTREAGEDPAVAALVAGYARQLSRRMGEPLGTSLADVEWSTDTVRSRETAIGDLVADAMREAAAADVALVNGGTIRAGIPAGPVTVGTVHDVLPFDNWLMSFELTGRELREALEAGLMRLEVRGGGFPQVSGLTFTFDRQAPAGARVVAVTVGGAPLEETRRYVVATHDFLAAGGDGYTVFAGREPLLNDTGRWLRDILAEWWRRRGSVSYAKDGRIMEVGQ